MKLVDWMMRMRCHEKAVIKARLSKWWRKRNFFPSFFLDYSFLSQSRDESFLYYRLNLSGWPPSLTPDFLKMATKQNANLAKYDLTQRMAPYFDPHFMFPILKWLREKRIYSASDICAAEFALANNPEVSRMSDFAVVTHEAFVDALKASNSDVEVAAPNVDKEQLQAEFCCNI